MNLTPQIWHGCYDKSLKGFITDASFNHPAKFSLGLIERIYDHCLARGYFTKGSLVGDVFGGVAIGGLVAAYRGVRWIGCELEPKFVGFCRQNIALHRSKLEYLGCPLPLIIQGDSRFFAERVQAVVSSPPYAETETTAGNVGNATNKSWGKGKRLASSTEGYGQTSGQIGRLKSGAVDSVIASPPFTQGYQGGGGINKNGYTGKHLTGKHRCGNPDEVGKRTYQGQGGQREPGNIETLKEGSVEAVVSSPPFRDARSDTTKAGATKGGGPCAERLHSVQAGTTYGATDGQIDNLKTGDVHAVISSPPYAAISTGAGGLNTKPAKHEGQQSGRSAKAASQDTDQKYGTSDGQIARLKSGDVQAVVTSPPWENNAEGSRKGSKMGSPEKILKCNRGNGASDAAVLAQAARDEQKTYGDSEGQIGKERGETYWEAMDQVYRSCFQTIRPGGVIVLVVKDYCKDGKRVRLCDDTLRLLEHIGFQPLERIHAMLVSETVEAGLFGEEKTKRQRKSFFRRLYEAKIPEGDERRIDHEEVLIARRPL